MKTWPLSLVAILLFPFSVLADANTNMLLGNPSFAVSDLHQPDNYLVVHDGFVLSYNHARGTPNWVAWHLDAGDMRNEDRCNCYTMDKDLPKKWRVKKIDYEYSGFDRGHMCPSEDRTDTKEINKETFLMSNMQPQVEILNQQTWKYLEEDSRKIVKQGNELYIYAGCYGNNGRIEDKITIPSHCFKVILVLKNGDHDLKRVQSTTRVIAVDIPNEEGISTQWQDYITTIDEIESHTGLDFLSTINDSVEEVLESSIAE